ncbi:MAG: ABC transporter permease, partial [Clostridia bacterium]|nr:ABC transporter permease [Clostridia bacterium]
DTEDNYHFSIVGLEYAQKEYIASQPWAQACWDIVTDADAPWDNVFRVRVTWDEVERWGVHAKAIFDRFGLWSRAPYKARYDSAFEDTLSKLQARYYGAASAHGMPLTVIAQQGAERYVLQSMTANITFISDTINAYIFQPQFFGYMTLFGLFFASVSAILSHEHYKRKIAEYGTLRSLGMKRRDLTLIHVLHTVLASIASIPIAVPLTYGAVKGYLMLMQPLLTKDAVYMTLVDTPPLIMIVMICIFMTCLSGVGAFAVCLLYRKASTMELLRGAGTVDVSFVPQTSSAFELCPSTAIYNRLYLLRTRKTQLLGIAVIAMMMPLPLMYLESLTEDLFSLAYTDILVSFCYNLFQALFIFITALTVTTISSFGTCCDRHREFAVLRTLGMTRARLTAMIRTQDSIRAAVVSVLALLLFLVLSDTRLQSSAVREPLPMSSLEYAAKSILNLLGAMLFVYPSVFSGTALSMRRFHRGSIIDALR